MPTASTIHIEVLQQALEAGGRTEVVDEAVANRVEGRDVPYPVGALDVLLEDLLHDALHIDALVPLVVVLDRRGEAAEPDVLGELQRKIICSAVFHNIKC